MNLIFNHAVMKYSPEKDTAKALLLYLMDKPNYLQYTDVAAGYNAGASLNAGATHFFHPGASGGAPFFQSRSRMSPAFPG